MHLSLIYLFVHCVYMFGDNGFNKSCSDEEHATYTEAKESLESMSRTLKILADRGEHFNVIPTESSDITIAGFDDNLVFNTGHVQPAYKPKVLSK